MRSHGCQPPRRSAQSPRSGLDVPAGFQAAIPAVMSARITTGKLEPLGLVHGHDADALARLLHDRRLRRLALRLLAEPLDEARNEMLPAASYVRASSATRNTLASACSPHGRSTNAACARVAVSSRSPSPRPAGRYGARGVTATARATRPQAASEARPLPAAAVGMQSAEPMPVLDQLLVADGEERPLERRVHGQLVVRPLEPAASAVRRLSTSSRGGTTGRRPGGAESRAPQAPRHRGA